MMSNFNQSFHNDVRKKTNTIFKVTFIGAVVGSVVSGVVFSIIIYVAIHFLAKVW